jgi:hypothetical protein
MRLSVRLLVLAFACTFSTGCFTSFTLVKIRGDGSGTIEHAMSMNAEMAKQLQEMLKGFGGADQAGNKAGVADEMFSEKEMKEAATKFGTGVTFVSSKPIATADRVGRIATYAFTDITKVRINQKPESPGGKDAPGSMGGDSPEDVTFTFAKNPAGTSTLKVLFPEPKFDQSGSTAGDGAKSPRKKPTPQELEMVKKLVDGLKIAIALETSGPIVKTNCPYVDGQRLTLLEMDFAELITNEQALEQVAQPTSLEEAKKALQGIKGMKIALEKELMVEFKNK